MKNVNKDRPQEKFLTLFWKTLVWHAAALPRCGMGMRLVTEIKQSLVPAGANLTSIYKPPIQQQQVFFPMRGFTDIGQQNYSTITQSFSRIS